MNCYFCDHDFTPPPREPFSGWSHVGHNPDAEPPPICPDYRKAHTELRLREERRRGA